MKKLFFVDIITTLHVLLFLYASISKLMDYSLFYEQLVASPILAPISKSVAFAVPTIEIIIVIMIIIPRLKLKGFYLSTIVVSSFTLYIIAILLRSENIPCSCGGLLEELTWEQHIFFNISFIILTILGIICQQKIQAENKNKMSLILNT